jgi:uncharacterized protein (DUF2141 family)
MLKGLILWFVVFLVLVGTEGITQSTVKVSLSGLNKATGQILFSLYESADGFPDQPKKAFQIGSVPVHSRYLTISIESLPPGKYALAIIHDENGNGRLDKNKLGIPIEPVGFSNNVMGAFGPPKFQRAQFNIQPGKNELKPIRLRMGQ